MRRKQAMLAALLALSLLLTGCGSQTAGAGLQKETTGSVQVIDPVPAEDASIQSAATLYFAYGDTGLLRQESRQIDLLPNETREKALVRALLEGSREAGAEPLFPEKTEVLSTQAQDGVLYITFNESIYGRYSDEDRVDAAARARMALSALAATLTETGEYGSVQVMTQRQGNAGAGMRLTTRFLREGTEKTLPPLTRQSDCLPTPSAYARAMLEAWRARSGEGLAAFISGWSGRTMTSLTEQMAAAPALIAYAAQEGTVSPDGKYAVICADLTFLLPDGSETKVSAYPLRLVREDGGWKIRFSQLISIMGEKEG